MISWITFLESWSRISTVVPGMRAVKFFVSVETGDSVSYLNIKKEMIKACVLDENVLKSSYLINNIQPFRHCKDEEDVIFCQFLAQKSQRGIVLQREREREREGHGHYGYFCPQIPYADFPVRKLAIKCWCTSDPRVVFTLLCWPPDISRQEGAVSSLRQSSCYYISVLDRPDPSDVVQFIGSISVTILEFLTSIWYLESINIWYHQE